MNDFEDYRIVDRRGLPRARVFRRPTGTVEVRFSPSDVRDFPSMGALERWVSQRRWRLVGSEWRELYRNPPGERVVEGRRPVLAAASASDEEFAQRYMITSVTGRVWNRTMIRKAAMDQVRRSPLPGLRGLPVEERAALVDRVLDDDAFMRGLAGTVPARVVEAIEDRVWKLAREGAL